MSYHRVLQKQIDKKLPVELISDEKVKAFLSDVSNYYETCEKDKKISDHAFAISEKEYQEVVVDLKNQNDIKHKSILRLKEAIHALDPEADEMLDESDNIIDIIDFLQLLIVKTKKLETALIQAKVTAEKAAKAKSDFLSVMSHEIRTPLNAIIGYIHLLIHENPLPEQMEFMKILQISAGNLLSLINDVLDYSKIEEGKISFIERDFDLRKLVSDIRLANKVKAEERGNTLRMLYDEDLPKFVKGDNLRLSQILNNLVSNAIKFTQNGSIIIEAHLKQTSNDFIEVYFSVTDTGIGISPENYELIFEKFTQEHSYITREYGGTGLGLAIIKKLLQLQDRDIYLESELGKGSKFYFSVPFAKSEEKESAESMPERTHLDLGEMKILLVEDVEFNKLLAKKMLSNWNAKVDVADNGLVALEMAKLVPYDVILMDVQMPVMDGLTASKEIRKFDKIVPIIALTASTSLELQESFSKLGISDFIPKPINPDHLNKVVFKCGKRTDIAQG